MDPVNLSTYPWGVRAGSGDLKSCSFRELLRRTGGDILESGSLVQVVHDQNHIATCGPGPPGIIPKEEVPFANPNGKT